jgi:hypothetical protein
MGNSMKNILSVKLLLIFSFLLYPAFSYSETLSAGMSIWYADWKFISEDLGDPEIDPAFLSGPALSYSFEKNWILGTRFLYGQYENGSPDGSRDTFRFDLDTTLSYKLFRYMKIFSGVKYMGYGSGNLLHHSAGPGIGLGLIIPLRGNLFMLGNVSLMYLRGKHNEDGDNEPDIHFTITEKGYNLTISLAYYFENASTTLAFGYRYHYFHIDYETEILNAMEMTFYGLSFSAIYSFEL